MNNSVLFSVVAYIDDKEKIAEFINSISTENCIDKTEVILVADGENSIEIEQQLDELKQDFPFVRFVSADSSSTAACYNAGMKSAIGKWIHFTYISATYSEFALSKVLSNVEVTYKYAVNEEGKVNCVTCLPYEAEGHTCVACMSPYVMNRFDTQNSLYRMRAKKGNMVDLNINTNSVNLALFSFIMKTDLAKEIGFNEENIYEAEHEFLLRLFVKEPIFYNVKKCQVHIPMKSETALCDFQYARVKGWYTDAVKAMQKVFDDAQNILGYIPVYLQIAAYYIINNKYSTNYFERDTGTLNRDEAFEFDNECAEIFRLLDDKVIFSNYPISYSVPPQIQMHVYRSKYGQLNSSSNDLLPYKPAVFADKLFYIPKQKNISEYNLTADENGNYNFADFDDLIFLTDISKQTITMQVINCIDNQLEFDCRLSDEYFHGFEHKLIAVIADNKFNNNCIVDSSYEAVDIVDTDVYSAYKCFGITLTKFRRVHLSIDPSKLIGKKLVFALEFDNVRYSFNINYIRAYSRLSGGRFNYWMYAKHQIASPESKAIKFKKCGPLKHFGYEMAFMADNLLRGKTMSFKDRLYCVLLRFLADILYPIHRRKHIWMTFDKLYKAGDNGEYMFKYCNENQKKVNCYYIVSPESLDYERLKKAYGRKILAHQSFRQRLLALNAEAVLATHATVMRYCGYNNTMQPFFKDKFKSTIICIQHGLTIQKIAQYQSRVFDNIRLYTLASKYEWENICNETYGFTDKQLRLTGLPRYDGLKNNDQHQILITPTWRRNVVNGGIAFQKKTHNDSFKNSTYYKIYNGLINDQRLIDCAKKNGYRLIYLLHPAMSAQAEDYETNDYVELVQATGDMNYEKILTESSLMLTDYSGVQFDFAYQRKALVYYHPDTLPPHYDPGKIDYETMGFGPICRNHEEIVATLCEYMNNNCKNPEEYIRRADDFFAFDDFNNCKRIYEYITQFLEEEYKSNNNNIRY
ncbi:MAG: CDP-glycerol glycerophosphotransferase family protein [Faecalibacterium sp.]|nr:CDP-glycerol glycerophosphotransferase family protein [Ruminococcus sp.]MCM1392219.1 CDP-glycerol glycerophosphotransferase family protein [Ruminococcus sp.]MCM1485916.1 CDP-glycerol glycerophosphotransferase family protein [Faecalibacterium sp.]